MNAAKRMLALLIALTLIFTTGCGQANVQGDSDTSVEPNSTDSAEVTFDLTKYDVNVTYWATENTCYVYGGYILEIVTGGEYGENAHLRLTCIQMAPASREAEASAEIPLSEITDNKVSFSFENDGWGHSGNVTLVFLEDSIMFAVENVEYTDSSYPETWGLYENTGTLISRPTLYIDYFDSQENYDYEYSEEQEAVYDTSKASRILASLGLTEQEFKDSCTLIGLYSKDIQYADLVKHPNDYIGGFFYDKAYNVSSYILESNDGYRVYELESYSLNALVYDLRDDDHDPTITGGFVGMYMIFMGTTRLNGYDRAAFKLIAIDE